MPDGRSVARATSRQRRSASAVLALALAAALCVPSARAQGRFELADVQAAILEKIISFVRWPPAVPDDARQPFVVTILGPSPLEPRLAHMFAQRPVQGRRTIVRRVDSLDQLGTTHVLFITSPSEQTLRDVLARVRDQPILTASATPGFGLLGVAVNLIEQGGRVRFEINQQALKRAQLRASYQLLSVARLVDERED